MHAIQNGSDPPLAFDHSSFDLAWALSVFTHLTSNSLPWLADLHRVLKPGGHLIATYMGRRHGEWFTHEPWDEDRIGMNVLRRDQGWEQGGPIVLMSDWWTRAHWGRVFEILASAPVHGQTWVLMRRRDVEITAAELAELADDPRGVLALQHNLRQVEQDRERTLVEVRNEHARILDEITRAYEQSLSWQITRPLRAAARRFRERSAQSR